MPVKTPREISCADDYDPNSMPVDKAREFIRAFLNPITESENLTIYSALNRISAEDIISPINVPGHDNSAMDGYAVRFSDLQKNSETVLEQVGTSLAGKPFNGTIKSGQCVRIMTGAVMPQHTDTVIMQEHVRIDHQKVFIPAGQRQGQNRRKAGEDLSAGQIALKKGSYLRPAELGLVSSLGIGEIKVYRQLRVAFFSTGDELQPIGTPLEAGQIYDSNRYTLAGMLQRLGVDVIDMGIVKDDPNKLESALTEAANIADVIITSGGVSVGEADYIKDLLSRLGEVLFWKIAMKPGRPLACGKIQNSYFFGLPGNPVAVMVTFYQFVRDALIILMGRNEIPPLPTFKAKCISVIKKTRGRTEFQRGILMRDADGGWIVQTTGEQGSGILRSMSEANCFIVLPNEQGSLEAGALVDVQIMEGLV